MTLFRDKYRIESARLQTWDYSNQGLYYMTTCTKHRVHLFGNIQNGLMLLNKNGEILKEYLLGINSRYKNVMLGEWVIMPNHLHCVICIMNGEYTPFDNATVSGATVSGATVSGTV